MNNFPEMSALQKGSRINPGGLTSATAGQEVTFTMLVHSPEDQWIWERLPVERGLGFPEASLDSEQQLLRLCGLRRRSPKKGQMQMQGLECSGMIIAHCSLELLGSRDSPLSTSYLDLRSCRPGWRAMAQPRLTETCASLPGSSDSPASASQVSGTVGTCHHAQLKTGFYHIGQAGLEFLTSDDLLALASQKMKLRHVAQAGLELLSSSNLPFLTSHSAGIISIAECEVKERVVNRGKEGEKEREER
ncbi:hypothetical protein AAY473_022214 [Plecturocebus cupreus]